MLIKRTNSKIENVTFNINECTNIWEQFDFYYYIDEVLMIWHRDIRMFNYFYPLKDFLREKKLINAYVMVTLDDPNLILLPRKKEVILSYV